MWGLPLQAATSAKMQGISRPVEREDTESYASQLWRASIIIIDSHFFTDLVLPFVVIYIYQESCIHIFPSPYLHILDHDGIT